MSNEKKEKPFDDAPIPDATILSNGEYFNFHTTLPKCETTEQMKCILKVRFQHHIDQFFANYGTDRK